MLWIILLLPAAAVAQTFVNVSEDSGTSNPGLYCTGAVAGDYDGDGDLDLYVTNWGTGVSIPANALYQNDGAGVFQDVAAGSGVANDGNSAAAAWSDFDNDGDLDLYVVDYYDQDFLYENTEGRFAEVGRTRGTVNVQRQGTETCVTWGDYDGDGWSDIYVGKYYYANELYHNRGDGTFDLVTDLGALDPRDTQAADWVDVDGDGRLDLYVVNREQENALFRNTAGAFVPGAAAVGVADKEIGQDAAWADFDNDGDVDLFLGNVGANALYRNDGPAGFTNIAAAAGVRASGAGWITARAAWADYDGDGDLDLYLANGADKDYHPDVLLANSGGTFADVTAAAGLWTGATAHTHALWADLDQTGSPDLYLTDAFGPWGQGSMLFRNDTPGAAFIRVGIQGLGPGNGGGSRNAIGAQVRLVDIATAQLAGYRQVQQATGGPSLSFGAVEGTDYRVEVQFPGTTRLATVPIAADVRGSEYLTVVEPEP
jgi:enediyne biosynthesis protein E4